MKKMWEEFPNLWKTESAFMNFLRGGIRKGLWEKNPVKLSFIQKNRVKVPLGKKTLKNPDGMVFGCKCELCGELFRQNQIQVDHKIGENSLKTITDLENFINKIVFVTYEDLQIVCKDCHKIKTHAERYNMTFEEAIIEKKAIEFSKTSVSKQKYLLLTNGFTEDEISNAKNRRNCYVELLKR